MAKPKQKKGWVRGLDGSYPAAMAAMVTHSAKSVNSNAQQVGVRVAQDSYLPLPYVSVRTEGPGRVPLETLMLGGAGTATASLQVLALLDNNDLALEAPEEDRAAIAALQPLLAAGYAFNTDSVGMRMKQVLLPSQEEDGYISLSPLHAPGLSTRLRGLLKKEADTRPDGVRKRPMLALSIGGKNPQNLGLRIRDMQRIPVFEAPAVDPRIQQAYRLQHKGTSLHPDQTLLQTFYEVRNAWLSQRAAQHKAVQTAAWRSRERELLEAMAVEVLTRARQGREALLEAGLHPGPRLPAHQRALLDAEQRYPGWEDACVQEFLLKICRHAPGIKVRRLHDSDLDGHRSALVTLFGRLA